jgi:hypothetical protein
MLQDFYHATFRKKLYTDLAELLHTLFKTGELGINFPAKLDDHMRLQWLLI